MAMSSIAGLRVIIKLFNLFDYSQRSECEQGECGAIVIISTVVPTKSDSDAMMSLQSYQGLRIDR